MTRYELLDRIGVGGMAEIFRGKAVAAGGFEKPVAIKRILAHLSQDPRFVELLIAEAKVLSLLKHRNIVQIFDVGVGDDGKYFLVMEYVDGKDLGAIQTSLEARRRQLPFDLALHIGAELCEALEHAHAAKAPDGRPMSLVHRDVSPSNVLLSRAGEIKLTDFGIAKRAEQEATRSGAVRGKFAYISPEQARNEHVEPRSDVFSIGILLWELVTSRRLFSGLGDLDALRMVREGKIQRPSEVDPNIAPAADALIMSALSRDIQKRPTAGQLGQKLRSLRYSLDDTVGDPATELARFVEAADEAARVSRRVDSISTFEHDPSEMTVIRVRTADAFASDKGLAQARLVIDHFEEEQTRLASLTGDQLKLLRRNAPRDSGELAVPTVHGSKRSRRETEEPTVAREPMVDLELPTPPHQHLDSDENTRMIAPRDRRTPAPERIRAQSVPPPVPRPPTAAVPMPPRSTEPVSAHAPYPEMPLTSAIPAQRGSIPQLSIGQMPMAPPQHVQAMPMQPPMQPQSYAMPPHPMTPPAGYAPYPQSTPFQTGVRPPVPPRTRGPAIQPWMLVVGALIMAALAFGITRSCISTKATPTAPAK